MAKPKFDYKGKEFLDQVEALASRGMTDKEIALSLGLSPTYFYEKKAEISELSEALVRVRAQTNAVVRQKYLKIGLGGLKVKTVTRKIIEDSDGEEIHSEKIQEVETELPPNPSVLSQWLYAHDPEWREIIDASKRLDLTSKGEAISFATFLKTTDPKDG